MAVSTFWKGQPHIGRKAHLLALTGRTLSAEEVQGLCTIATNAAFEAWVVNRICPEAQLNPASDCSTGKVVSFAFFRGTVQISYGNHGFVPLANLLNYEPSEIAAYLACNRRVAIPDVTRDRAGNRTLH